MNFSRAFLARRPLEVWKGDWRAMLEAGNTMTLHTEGSCEGSSRDRGKRQRWKRWHRRRAQDAEAQELLRGINSSHRSDSQTAAAKRARHQNLCGVVFGTYIVQQAERSGRGKGLKAGLQRRSATGGPSVVTGWDLRLSGRGRVWSKDSSRKGRSWERYWRRSRITWRS